METLKNINKDLNTNIENIEAAFENCGDFVKRKFAVGKYKELWLYVAYFDMMANNNFIDDNVMKRLITSIRLTPPTMNEFNDDIFEGLKDGGISASDMKEEVNLEAAINSILSGDTALFIDGSDKAIIIASRGFPSRGVPSSESEVVIRGARDAFSEVFRINTTLIRRRINDTRLKLEQSQVGKRTKTAVGLMYMDDLVRPNILEETQKRIKNINIDAVLDSGYIEQLIEKSWASPFPQAQATERPDKVASAILEGRIAIVVDNTPFVLIVPATLDTFFQSPDDYYQRFELASLLRILRFLAGFLALTASGLYIATAVFHPSMLPTSLMLKMASARMNVPFPVVVEILIMEAAFELLKEAGIRLPAPIGSTIGIVGGLIVGQAAVEAGIVSPIAVIVVAFGGICSFVLPSISLVNAFRMLKFVLIFLSAAFGFVGFWIGIILTSIHLASLKSFGIPYMFPFVSGEVNGYSDFKDSIFRAPLFKMRKRPIFCNPDSVNRQGGDEK
ncbi:MAG: spore germination protein [Defluviitaleaceae bacterium]|nr:spore germination protein [Defluviitaleaceae bacterium]